MAHIAASQYNNLKRRLELVAAFISILAIIISGLYTLSTSNNNRAKDTILFLDRLEKDRLYESKQRLEKTFEQIVDYGKNHNETDIKNYIINLINEQVIKNDLDQVFEFFDQLRSCSLASLCDDQVGTDMIGKYAYDVVSNVNPYITYKKIINNDDQYAYGIQYYSNLYSKSKKNNQ